MRSMRTVQATIAASVLTAVAVAVASCGVQPAGIIPATNVIGPCQSGVLATPAPKAAAPSAQTLYLSVYPHASITGDVYALDASSGAPRWCEQIERVFPTEAPGDSGSGFHSMPPPTSARSGTPIEANGLVYTAVEDGYAYAFDARDGSLRWQASLDGGFPGDLTVAGGTVYVGTLGGVVYAFDAASGAPRWSTQTPSKDYFAAAPLVANGTVYLSSYDHSVYALAARDGSILWRFLTNGRVYCTPTLSGGVLYFGAGEADRHVYAVDATTGRIRWSYETGGNLLSSPAILGDTLYFTSTDTYLYALSAASGQLLWRSVTNTAGAPAFLADGVIYLTGDGLYAIDPATRALRWKNALAYDQSVEVYPPLLFGNNLYVLVERAGIRATLYELDPADGTVRWQMAITGSTSLLTAADSTS